MYVTALSMSAEGCVHGRLRTVEFLLTGNNPTETSKHPKERALLLKIRGINSSFLSDAWPKPPPRVFVGFTRAYRYYSSSS